MSKYREIKTQFKDTELLLAALKAAGVTAEYHPAGIELNGYAGQRRTAHVVVRKQTLRDMGIYSFGDMGWRREKDGLVHVYDANTDLPQLPTQAMLGRVRQQYARSFVQREATRRGMRMTETRDEQGNIHIQLRSVR